MLKKQLIDNISQNIGDISDRKTETTLVISRDRIPLV